MGKHESVEGIRDQVETLMPPSEPPASPAMSDGRGEPTEIALAAIEALKIESARETSRIGFSGSQAIPSLELASARSPRNDRATPRISQLREPQR